jgi:hypothetical protein
MLCGWPGAPRRVGAVGAARPARSAAGPGAAQRRRLIKYGSTRQRVASARTSSWALFAARREWRPGRGGRGGCCRRVAVVIGAVVFDVGECLVDETREYGTWADWLGVPRHTFSAVSAR